MNVQLKDFKARAFSATLLSFANIAGSQLVRFAGNLLLTRLLFPEAFGLLSIVMVLLYGVTMLSDIGIRDSIVRSSRGDDDDFLDTAWTLQVIRGGILFVACWALAYPFAWFFGNDELASLIQICSVSVVLQGFNPVKEMNLDRHLKLGRVVILQLGSQVAGLIVMILLAWRYHEPWALAVGNVFGAFFQLFAARSFLPGRNGRFLLDAAARKEITGYGRWIVVSSALTFAAASSDRLIIGRLSGLEFLGVYGIAVALAETPSKTLVTLSNRVVFPLYSRILAEGGSLVSQFERVRGPLLIGGAAISSLLMAAGGPLVGLLYDERYTAAGGLVLVLGLAGWIRILSSTNECALKALGFPQALAAGTFARVCCLMVFFPLAVHLMGVEKGVWLLVVADVLAALVTSYFVVVKFRITTWWVALPSTVWVILSVIAGTSAAHHFSHSNGGRLLVAVLVTGTLWSIPLWRALRAIARLRAGAGRGASPSAVGA